VIRNRFRGDLRLEARDLHPHRGLGAADAGRHVDGWLAADDGSPRRAALLMELTQAVARRADVGVALSLGLDRSFPGGAADVVREASDLVREGCRTLVFEDYGSMPVERFDWVRQAVRFARREAGESA
jgi:hypothetical protein